MLEYIAVLLVGMGLMFYGMELLNDEAKRLAGRKFRNIFKRWTQNKFIGMSFGFISGIVTHSGSSATIIFTNLTRGGLTSVKNAIMILATANVGTVVLVFLFAINIKLGIMYLLGISAILYSLNEKASKMAVVRVLLGIGMLLFGFHELEIGAEHIIEMEFIHKLLVALQNNSLFLFVLFLIGFILRFLTQSSSTVAILIMSLGHIGILDTTGLMFMLAGAPFAAGIAMVFESKHIRGSAKQIPAFQILYELSGAVIFALLLVIEKLFSIPLLQALIENMFKHTPEIIAVSLLIIRLIPFIFTLIYGNVIIKYLETKFPPIREETLSSPEFIYDSAIEDPESALELVEKETTRIIQRLPLYLESVRQEHDSEEIIDNRVLHNATNKLGNEVDMFIKEMFKESLSHSTSERLLKIQNSYGIIIMIEESLNNLVEDIRNNEVPVELNRLRINVVESLHAVLLTCIDSNSSEEFTIGHLQRMTSDKGNLMENIRGRYLSNFEVYSSETVKSMMYVTDLYQRIIWLINKWSLSK